MNRYSLQFKTSEAEYRATVRAFVRCIPMAIQLGKITPALRHNLQRFAGTFDDAEFAATLYSAMQPSEIDPNAPRLIRSAPAAALPGAEAGTPDGEEVRRIVRDALRRPLSSPEAAYLNRLAALTSEVVTGNAALVTAEGELVELEAENARLTSEVRARDEALADTLVRAEKAEAELAVLRKHLGRVSPTKLLKSNIDRFWKNVEKTETCWLWVGTLDQGGYGRQFVGSRSIKAHRYSWELHVAPIPAGLHVLHNCPGGDNRRCVNPAHLWLGTLADNNADTILKGRGVSPTAWPKGATACRNGHQLTAESIVILPDGARRCRICRLARQRQYTKRRTIRERAERAARLASPSPTGAT